MARLGVVAALLLVCEGNSQTVDAADDLQRQMQQYVDQHVVSGAVTLVAQYGKIVSQSAIGLADIDASRPMRSDTIFWIASMTKPITTTAVMILQDEGKLSVA